MSYSKQKNKIRLNLVIALIVISLFSISAGAKTLTDLADRKLSLPDKIERIVAIGPGALRMVVYLEAENMVVGVEEFEKRNQQRPYIIAHPELTKLPVIGPQFGGDAELIAAQNPDLIISSYLSQAEMNNLQAKTSIPVISINDGTPGSMTEAELKMALKFLAEILNKNDRAEELINIFDQHKNEMKSRTSNLDLGMNVYIGGIGNKGAQGITSTEANYPPFEYLGLNNIIEDDKKSNFTISKERLLLENPELIFIDQGGIELVEQDLKREEFKYLKAYQENEIYQLLPYNHYTTNFATMLANSYFIAETLYPEAFKMLEAKEKANQIYKQFVGQPVYSEMAEIFGGFKKMKLN